MNRDSLRWEELMQDLDFLFTFAALPANMTVGEMNNETVDRLCRLVCRKWVAEFDSCDNDAIPVLTEDGRRLHYTIKTSALVSLDV